MSEKSRELPRSVIVLVVVATGVATVWAAAKAGPLAPYTSWDRAQQAVQQVWTRGGPQQAAVVAPGMPATGQVQGQVQGMAPSQLNQPILGPASPAVTAAPVAPVPAADPPEAMAGGDPAFQPADPNARTVGLPGVPAIVWGTPRPHRDRGPCVNCHTVTRGNGQRLPIVFSFSSMPHEFRGICNNCHQISTGGAGGNLVAGMRVDPMANAAPAAPPNEAEWRGIEARPGTQGVLVAKADGIAARAGLKTGDVVDSINGVAVRSMNDFVQATENGDLPQATIIAKRNGQRLAFEVQQAQQAGLAPDAAPQQPMAAQSMAGQQQQAMPQPQQWAPAPQQQQQAMPQPQQWAAAPQQQQLAAAPQWAPAQPWQTAPQMQPQQWAVPQTQPQWAAPQPQAQQWLLPQWAAPQQPQQWVAPQQPQWQSQMVAPNQ